MGENWINIKHIVDAVQADGRIFVIVEVPCSRSFPFPHAGFFWFMFLKLLG